MLHRRDVAGLRSVMSSARKPSAKADIPDIHSESVEELREAFELFDTKGAGEIPMLEMVDSMQGLGFHEKNPMMFEMVLKISAKRKGGSTNFVQFAEDMAELIRDVHQEKDLRMIFNMLDTENSGRISLENLKKVANEFGDTMSDAELLEMMDTAKYVDPEGLAEPDGKLSHEVSFVDFYNLMTKGKPGPAAKETSLNSPAFGTERSPSVAAANRSGGVGGRSFASRV
eukprot:jgi/Undpi1/730/HiC_scaffold_10.g04194.m1